MAQTSDARGWTTLIVDDDDAIHEVTVLALRRAHYFGLPVQIRSARSKREALELLETLDAGRLAVALVDVVMETDTAGLELVGALRERFGNPLQIIMRTGQPGIMAPDEVTSRFDISNYLAKIDATPDRLRTAIGLAIRNFRTQSAMRVLCESLATFTALFETATSTEALNQILDKALAQYAAVWQFDYLFVPDTREGPDGPVRISTPRAPWQELALRQIMSMDLNSHRSVAFSQLSTREGNGCWGCSIKPLGGRFTAAFALQQAEPPSSVLLRELHTLLRTWALARESVLLKRIAACEQNIRAEMHRERSDAIAQMVAGVAHEVNTPLGVANAAAATLREMIAKPHFKALCEREEFAEDMEDVQTSANLIQRNIARADEMIRSFRKLSVRQLVDEREEIDFLACIDDAVKLYSPKARRSGLQIEVVNQLPPGTPKWLGYPGHLSQVLLNLIANAERYAYDGGAGVVEVIVGCSQTSDGPQFQIIVRDHGKGIAKENLGRIFEAFFTTGRAVGGTGLGLSIVRNIVDSVFGGTVTCESTVGEGTAFKLAFSHCKKQEPRATEEVPREDRVQIFEQFVALQQKVVSVGVVSAEEQLALIELRDRVERSLAVQFQSEQDHSPRVPCSCPVSLRDPDMGPVVALDVSEEGIRLAFDRPLEVGQRLRLTRIDKTALAAQVEIVSVTKHEASDGVRWHCGAAFRDLGDTELRSVKLLLAQLMLAYWR